MGHDRQIDKLETRTVFCEQASKVHDLLGEIV
jgi:hypothetical protein